MWDVSYFLLACGVCQLCFSYPGMESLTQQFEQRIAEFLRRTRLSPSEFGERAIGDRKFCGDLRRGRSPTLGTVERVLAFMECYDRASIDEDQASSPDSRGAMERRSDAETNGTIRRRIAGSRGEAE